MGAIEGIKGVLFGGADQKSGPKESGLKARGKVERGAWSKEEKLAI